MTDLRKQIDELAAIKVDMESSRSVRISLRLKL